MRISLLIVTILMLGSFFQNCSSPRFQELQDVQKTKETETGNPVTVSLKLEAAALGTVSDLSVCPEALRLYPSDVSRPAVTVKVPNGPYTISTIDTFLVDASIPMQNYESAELQLAIGDSCTQSISFTNGSGPFKTNEKITLHYERLISVSSLTHTLKLSTQEIIDQVTPINQASQIKPRLESVMGEIQGLSSPQFVQLKEASVNNLANSISTTAFTKPVSDGNFVFCVLLYNSATARVSGVDDNAGNSYWRVTSTNQGIGPLANWSLETWSTSPIKGSTGFDVTVSFTETFSGEKNIVCHEYSGTARVMSPFDLVKGYAGTDSNVSLPAFNVSSNSLLLGVGVFESTGTAGSSFNQRSKLGKLMTQDLTVSSAGPYGMNFTNQSQNWMALQFVIRGE